MPELNNRKDHQPKNSVEAVLPPPSKQKNAGEANLPGPEAGKEKHERLSDKATPNIVNRPER